MRIDIAIHHLEHAIIKGEYPLTQKDKKEIFDTLTSWTRHNRAEKEIKE